MKYQLVFESSKVIPDDEFEEIIKPFITAHPEFTFKFAINLEGIKKEFWDKKEEMVNDIVEEANDRKNAATIYVEKTFDDISDLFKLDE